MAQVKPAAKFAGILLIVLSMVGLYFFADSKGWLNTKSEEVRIPFEDGQQSSDNVEVIDKTFKVGVVTWPGYAGGQLFNGGFQASENSGFYKEYGFKVEFVLIDDYKSSRDAFKAGELDLLWTTIDAFPTESANLGGTLIFAADKSRGGDIILSTSSIKSLNDFKNKRISVALGTPSHTFLIWALKTAGLSYNQVEIIPVDSAPESARLFKAGSVDAAVVWSPDDQECLEVVPGSRILTSTKEAGEIIADAFMVRNDILQKYPEQIANLVEGWLRGNAKLNTDPKAVQNAVKILTQGLNVEDTFIRQVINNVRFLTYGDNKVIFGLEPSQSSLTGEELYSTMKSEYTKLGLSSYSTPSWNAVSTTRILRMINLSGPEHEAERKATFTKKTVEEIESAPVLSTKSITVNFATGSAMLDGLAKQTLRNEFGALLRIYPNLRVRLEGNTDNVGNISSNIVLSQARAQAVANFLIQEYGFDANRFTVQGNGPNKPVDTNSTPEGRLANRRTDLILIN